MMYFLILLIPFVIFIGLLIRQNNFLKNAYVRSYHRVWALIAAWNINMKMENNTLDELDTLITDDSIKELESDLSSLEEAIGLDKSFVVSNTFTPKKKKLAILEKRIDKLEASARTASEA